MSLQLVSVDRPPGCMSAPGLFMKQEMWARVSFSCAVCGHGAADLRRIVDATADDFRLARQIERLAPQPDPYPGLPRATTISRMYGVFVSDLAA